MSALDDATRELRRGGDYTSDQMLTAMATLALAEEQRVANLLALAALLPSDSMGSTSERTELLSLARQTMFLT